MQGKPESFIGNWKAVGAALAAVGLTAVFWGPLWTGGGLIGGDVYYYFMPQKVAYAEALKAGEWPFWNDRVGFGYPTVGESQTGVFYPPHLLLYSTLSVDRAYALSMLLHYALAFFGAWLIARRVGLRPMGSLLTALVYTYGWFPCRISLEWSIVGGAWLPVALWLAESFLQSRRWRHVFLLAIVLAVQLLAGHFTMAFLTQLTLAGWVGLRVLLPKSRPWREAGGVGLALVFGFGLAAGQLWPTWELKQRSQRQTVTAEHDPAYGYLPVAYLTQTVAPWFWYPDGKRFQSLLANSQARTNRVEAHLYFGQLPLLLAVCGGVICLRSTGCSIGLLTLAKDDPDTVQETHAPGIPPRQLAVLCLALTAASLIYATGILVPITRHLPGFSFFEGPGRYGVIATLAIGLLAGAGVDRVIPLTNPSARGLLFVGLFLGTAGDLWLVGRASGIADSVLVGTPPVRGVEKSELRRDLLAMESPPRLLSPANNAGTILGVSVWPPYLGLGPAAYSDPARKPPDPLPYKKPATPAQLAWLRKAGVTHLLLLESIDVYAWREADGLPVVRFMESRFDPVLNPVLASNGPLRLYTLRGSRGRAAYAGSGTVSVTSHRPMRVVLDAHGRGGTVILTELMYPGWEVTIDGVPALGQEVEGLFRGVQVPAGRHEIVWTYRPRVIYQGAVVSGVFMFSLLVLGHLCFWNWRCW